MRYSQFSLVNFFVFFTFCLSAQFVEYQGDVCSPTGELVLSTCPSLQYFDITVSGEGNLGDNNRGIVKVYVDVDQVDGWNGQMHLISPNGDQFLLADESSFPDYIGPSSGDFLNVNFANCLNLPSHNSSGNPSGLTFNPVETFSSLNFSGGPADGVWSVGICQAPVKDAGPIEVYCVSVTFDELCPEIEEAIVTPADCGQSNGSVEFVVSEEGYCGGLIGFSLDGIDFDEFDTFNNLPAGTYTGYVAYVSFANLSSDQEEEFKRNGNINKALAPGECITEFEFTIEETPDTLPPTITNCPLDQTVILDDVCTVDFDIIYPFFNDECGIDFDNSGVTITNPAGDSDSQAITPGDTFSYSWGNPGFFVFDWFVSDFGGNMTTCQTVVTILDETPPYWATSQVTINIECGVDDIIAARDAAFLDLVAFDACGGLVTYSTPTNLITPQCGNSEYNDWFYTITDESGNANPILGEILINVNDNLAPTITGVPIDDITINCSDDFPYIPEVGIDVFADDLCQGDVTSFITVSSSLSFGDCLAGEPIEIQSFSYSVLDSCDNSATQSFSVLIYNNEQPVWDAPYSETVPIDITLECGVDDLAGAIAANTPTAQGCSGPADISISALQELEPCPAPSNTDDLYYTYQATDECNNFTFANVFIHYLDSQAPTLNGIPADVTVNCNESLPAIPNVTAMDVCEGDVTDLILYSFEIIDIGCEFQQNSFIETHTWLGLDYCGNSVSATWTITVFNDEEVDLGADIIACTGDAITLETSGLSGGYEWSTGETTSSIVVDAPGDYFVTVTGTSGCCSIDNIVVSFEDYPTASATGGTLDCSGTDIQIQGSSSTSGVSYAWTGPGGFTSNDQNPLVSQAGTYTLSVSSSAGCSDTADAIVLADTDAPDITTSGGTIDCNNSDVTIMGSSTTAGVSYAWTGPNGFTSSDPNPTVATAGEYNLVITAPNGCVSDGVAIVVDDIVIPTASTVGGTINCNSSNVTLTTTTSDPAANFAWTGPGGFTSNLQNPVVTGGGTYELLVTSDNGCTAMTSATVTMDTTIPDLNATGGTITCASSSVQLNATSNTAGVSYLWSGPNGYSNNTANPTVNVAGNYTITVAATNGCDSTLTVSVLQDISNPVASVPNNVITCSQTSITLMPTASDGVTYAWTGPAGFTSNQQNPVVSTAGMYNLVVTAVNGCTASASSTISQDNTPPTISVQSNLTLNCSNPNAQILLTTTNTGLTYTWTGPGGFTSNEQNPTVTNPGTYTVVATATNGCSSTATSSISEDIAVPNASATGGQLNCTANTVQINGSSTTAGISYSWSGPNSFTSTEQNPSVGSPGTYTLTVIASNGCTATATAEVTASSDLPNISAVGGQLNCIINEVQLSGSSSTAGVNFNWTGPGGFNSTEQNPSVTEPGQYTFTVTAPNGCVSETNVTVALDNSLPSVVAIGGQISCNQSSITLTSNSNDDVSYDWEGPGGFSSSEQNPEVSAPGEYILMVTAENGCVAETTVEVTVDDELPLANFATPSLDCENNQVILSIETNEVYSYSWTLDGSVISSGQNVNISEAGLYSVDVIAANGCTITYEYVLEEELLDMLTEIETVDATSSQNGSATIEILNYDNVASILWDNGETGASANDLTVGLHTVTVTTNLGCTFVFEFEIEMSTSVQEIDFFEKYNIYPTITSDIINLDIEFNKSLNSKMYILNTNGQLVKEISFDNSSRIDQQLDLSEFGPGVYIITLQAQGKLKSTRVVKM